MFIDRRRKACPQLNFPMLTGDGYIIRLFPLLYQINSKAINNIAITSLHLGNGIIEITQRGNIQCRGILKVYIRKIIAILNLIQNYYNSILPIVLNPLILINEKKNNLLTVFYKIQKLINNKNFSLRLSKCTIIIDKIGGFDYKLIQSYIRLILIKDNIYIGLYGNFYYTHWLGNCGIWEVHYIIIKLLKKLSELGIKKFKKIIYNIPMLIFNSIAVHNIVLDPGLHRIYYNYSILIISTKFGHICAKNLSMLAKTYQCITLLPLPEKKIMIIGLPIILQGILKKCKIYDIIYNKDVCLHIHPCIGYPRCKQAVFTSRNLAKYMISVMSIFDSSINIFLSGCSKFCSRPSLIDLNIIYYENFYYLYQFTLAVVFEGMKNLKYMIIIKFSKIVMSINHILQILAYYISKERIIKYKEIDCDVLYRIISTILYDNFENYINTN
ncbi:Precorrin-3B synthase [Candidatus Johnevansia muelleri]|uniref:Precorrin-3B synthase n=1 Tax=Candidatus Johnevansia muelleri TaxID=1495769 RepID=A0A078KDQ6_9GAMM|nr:Precorrin-3B synthase [Candidatus Evansia muelleri]